jgi:hypothetical protein
MTRRWAAGFRQIRWYCNHETTPQASQPVSPVDVITVTDPRHPLYGRTMPLLAIHETSLETWFEVEQAPGVRRRLPTSVTDRNRLRQPTFLSALNWDSVRQLLATYTAILAEPVEGTEDGDKGDSRDGGGTPGGGGQFDFGGGGVGEPDAGAAGVRTPGRGSGVQGTAERGAAR